MTFSAVPTTEEMGATAVALEDVVNNGVSVGQMVIVVVFFLVSVTNPRGSFWISLLAGVETLQLSRSKATVPLMVTK
jgi:hypothetical protein